MAERFVPIWHFDPREQYFPVSVEEYLGLARVRTSEGAERSTLGFGEWVTAASKEEQQSTTLFLPGGQPPPAQTMTPYDTTLNQAPVYTSSFRTEDGRNLFLNYVLLYTFNPAARVVCGCPLFNCGAHAADIEHVQLQITDGQLVRVYFPKHGGGNWVNREQLVLTGDRVHVYVALGAHACYERPGFQWRFGGLIPDWTSDQGATMDSHRVLPVEGPLLYRGTWGDGSVGGIPDKQWFATPEEDGPWRCS